MTTPDPKLAARLARLLAGEHEMEAESGCPVYEDLDQACGNAYRSNQLITTAEADARVEAAVLAGNAMVKQLDTMMLMLSGETAMTKSSLERALSGALDARNMWTDAVRSRGVTG